MNERAYTLAELAGLLGTEWAGDGSLVIRGVSTLEDARAGDLTFLANRKYKAALATTKASAVVVAPADVREGLSHLVSPNPYLTFARAVALFHPPSHPGRGVSAEAHVDPTAKVGEGAVLMAGAHVEAGASVGDRTVLYPGAYVGAGATIGADCVLYPNVTVRERCVLGDRVILQPGCVIGSDGFGFASGSKGHEKIPQVGIVRIEDDVEVGACTTIDRAALGETRIGRGTKIDNLVQIAHNVTVGAHCFLVSQVGVSGSTRIGDRVVLAGQAGLAGHIEVGAGSVVGARGGLMADLPAGSVVSGAPAMPHREWLRTTALTRRLPELFRRIQKIEKRLGAGAGVTDTEELE
jgi:UDP-3-O-[3-hydroxymyristoyl] glucosamine N-acyltransferase